MPYTRISLHAGRPPAFLVALSDGLHAAMVEAFDVPPADRFHVFQQHAPGELVVDRDYLGGPRGDGFVLIAITAGKPRSTDTKRCFYRRLAERLAESPGIAPRDVMVVITSTQAEDWSFANGVALIDALEP